MLTEHFVAAIGTPSKAPGTNVVKDAAIFIHELQPLSAQRTVLKKSATPRNCLAVSDNHVFAAQIDRGVVHVYSREKGNQEAAVPFTERITAIRLVCDDSVLILGSAEGRIFLWETATGRQITTNQSHLQAVTSLAVDQTSNFLLSASADSTVHVWSLPGLLSFANAGEPVSQLQTFSSHRSEVTDLVIGHSSGFCNIAVSVSKDKTCLVWNYHTNGLLRTYLLPDAPVCVALDGADRAVYIGYEDASIQQLDFYRPEGQAVQSLQNSKDGTVPVQPAASSRWTSPDTAVGSVLSISVSFDSTTVITGHQSGAVLVWDVGRKTVRSTISQSPLPGPVTNLHFLPIAGFQESKRSSLLIKNIVKPKFGAFDSSDGYVPGNYAVLAELALDLRKGKTEFQRTLTAPAFPLSILDEGLDELATWSSRGANATTDEPRDGHDDFMALDDNPVSQQESLKKENAVLKAQIEALRRLQTASFDKLDKLTSERTALLQREQDRLRKLAAKKSNGVPHDDVDMDFDD